MLDIAKGDIRYLLNQSHRYLHTVKRKDGLHSVLWVRASDVLKWREVADIAHIRHCISEVLGEEDGRLIFPTIYRKADAVKQRRREEATERKRRKSR